MPTASSRFGPIPYEDDLTIEIIGGLVGLPEARRFVLLENAEVAPFKWLVSVDGSEVALLVIDPRVLVPDYRVPLADEDRKRLGLEGDEPQPPILPLAVTILAEPSDRSTVNLRAPVVLNTGRMLAAQVVPAESPYSLHHPLVSA